MDKPKLLLLLLTGHPHYLWQDLLPCEVMVSLPMAPSCVHKTQVGGDEARLRLSWLPRVRVTITVQGSYSVLLDPPILLPAQLHQKQASLLPQGDVHPPGLHYDLCLG